ncbi:MAG: CBS domain-containing protein [Sandaracinaceae bacterium]|nr:CBS domain-containing protein [Sandaracinaceae bacterium]
MGRSYTVADIMTEHVVTVSEEDSLEQVTQNLDRFRFRHLPVVDGRKVVGVITERDLLRFAVSVTEVGPAASAKAVDLERNTFVAQVMTRNPITVPPQTPVTRAAALMVDGRFDCLPVVNATGELLGIVTAHDLLNLMSASEVSEREN